MYRACVEESSSSRAQGKNLKKLSSLKVSTDSMISKVMKSHTNEQAFLGTGRSAVFTIDQFTSEHLSEFIKNHDVIPLELSTGTINSST